MNKQKWESLWAQRNYVSLNETKEVPWDIKEADDNLKWFLERNSNVKTVLEIGCGNGNDANFMSENGFDVTAIDISDTAIQEAKERYPNSTAKFVVCDFNTYVSEEKYDLIYDRGCFHNNPEYRWEYMRKAFNLLNDNGKLLLISGNYNQSLMGEIKSTLPTPISICSVEDSSFNYFKINLVKEIVFKQNKDYYEKAIGWLIELEKLKAIR